MSHPKYLCIMELWRNTVIVDGLSKKTGPRAIVQNNVRVQIDPLSEQEITQRNQADSQDTYHAYIYPNKRTLPSIVKSDLLRNPEDINPLTNSPREYVVDGILGYYGQYLKCLVSVFRGQASGSI